MSFSKHQNTFTRNKVHMWNDLERSVDTLTVTVKIFLSPLVTSRVLKGTFSSISWIEYHHCLQKAWDTTFPVMHLYMWYIMTIFGIIFKDVWLPVILCVFAFQELVVWMTFSQLWSLWIKKQNDKLLFFSTQVPVLCLCKVMLLV